MAAPPLIVDIGRFRLEDGPGIRSVVFFKGCPLRCDFCQNPEAQKTEAEIAFRALKCIGCGECEKTCGKGAVSLKRTERIDRALCARCGDCCDACPTSALTVIGNAYTPDDLAKILSKDLPYYRKSGGGVTLSGGECTMFPDYVEELLVLLKQNDIHITLETCGFFDFETFKKKILPRVDLVYFDVKLADSKAHRLHTAKPNGLILKNLTSLLKEPGVEVLPRVPLVPGITDSIENLSAITRLLVNADAPEVKLLPYNPLGIDMLGSLGRPAAALPPRFMERQRLLEIYENWDKIISRHQ